MAADEVTTSLNIDITQFKKALTDANRYVRMANSEFDKASAGMENWAGSADGLRAKLSQLNKIQAAQEAQVAALQMEYDRVAQEQGESSKAAQEMAIRLNKAQAAVGKTAAQVKKYQGKLDEMEAAENEAGDEAKKMGNEVDDAGKATKKAAKEAGNAEKETGKLAGTFGKAAKAAGTLATGLAKIAGKTVVAGIKGITAASAGLVTAFLATGEASKEHITEMSKLGAAYKSAGHSAGSSKKVYKELYSIIGETDQAVEAAQQIALLAKSEKDAAAWAEQAAAVTGKFGDALQPETFFESANETLKLGEATGAYTQMLEGCGLNVEKFNEGLAACNTEGEKQAYMLETTKKALGGAGEAYREANAAVIENNKANAKFQETMALVGQAALPVTTALKNMGTYLLGGLMPNINKLGTAFTELLGGSKTAAQDVGNAVGGMLKTLTSKFTAALPTILTVGGSIITSLLEGLVQAAPGLANGVTQIVQYFIQAAPQLLRAGASMVSSLVGAIRANLPTLLSAGGNMLDNLLNGVVSGLPKLLQGAVSAAGKFVEGIQSFMPTVLSKGAELLGKLGEGLRTAIPNLISQGLDILMNFVSTLYDAAPKLIDMGFDFIGNLVQGILDALPTLISKGPEIISKFANIINDNVPKLLKKGMELVLQIVKGILAAIPTLIKNIPKIITAIVDVWEAFNWLQLGKKAITLLKNGISSMVGAVKSAGSKLLTTITGAIQSLPSKLLSLGKSAGTFLKNGISSMVGAVKSAGSNILTAVVNAIKALPSKLLSFGRQAMTSLGNAFQAGVTTIKSKASAIINGVTNTLATLPGKMLQIGKDTIQGLIDGIQAMVGKLYDSIVNALSGLVDKAKDALGINSPSKVFANIVGKAIPEGIARGINENMSLATKSVTKTAKAAVSAANAELSGSTINGPKVNGPGTPGSTGGRGGATYNFYQYNTSPKPLDRKTVYRQTKNALKFATSNA